MERERYVATATAATTTEWKWLQCNGGDGVDGKSCGAGNLLGGRVAMIGAGRIGKGGTRKVGVEGNMNPLQI